MPAETLTPLGCDEANQRDPRGGSPMARSHVDVVESDKRVISLVGPYYTIDERVTIHHADAFEQSKTWPKDTRWNLAWHDIWADLCEDNLQEMFKLHRSYGRRVDWQGSWGKEDLIRQRIRERRERGWDDE